VPIGIGRKLNLAVASAEFIQLLGGYSDVHQLTAIQPRFLEFTDAGRLRGAYGPRLRTQLRQVVRLLQRDPASRQAVVNLWRHDELETSSSDVPCTLSLGFTIRDDVLDARVTMRSSDLWLGIPYDFAQFTALQRTLAAVLNVGVGSYTHTSWSLHLYEEHLELASQLTTPTDWYDSMPPVTLGVPMIVTEQTPADLVWLATADHARRLGLNQLEPEQVTAGSLVHLKRLYRYQPDRRFCSWCHYTYLPSESKHPNECHECYKPPVFHRGGA
jgi:hypothetical protein